MKGYGRSVFDELISSMEDYLEMICGMKEEGDPIHISSLVVSFHVGPSSVSRMLDNLREVGYINSKKYGSIMVVEKGYEEGRYLLHRYQVLQDPLCTLDHTGDELELMERIGHSINHRTVAGVKQALPFLRPKSDIVGRMG